jgi:heme A synthase
VALAKAETVEKLPALTRNIAYLAAGALVAYSALVLILLSFGWALRELFISRGMSEGMSMFLGLLIVGIVVGIVSAVLISKAIAALKHTSLAPEKTVQTLKEDKQWVQTKITTT